MMTRDEAEAAARKGAKVRHESWGAHEWVTTRDGMTVAESGSVMGKMFWPGIAATGWSIVEPAPPPGTVLPLSECGVGWLVRDDKNIGIVLQSLRLKTSSDTAIECWQYLNVTLLSAAPGWTPVGEGDPQIGAMVQLCWQSGNVSTGPLRADALAYHGALFWRDASHDTPAPVEPDLAARGKWSALIEHDGKGCPVPGSEAVIAMRRNGTVSKGRAERWGTSWDDGGHGVDIVSYRRKASSLLAARVAELEARMTAIENIVIPTPPFEGEALTRLDASLRGAAFLRTSRKPAPGVMTDDG